MNENDVESKKQLKKGKKGRPKKKFFQKRSSWIFLGVLVAFIILAGGVIYGYFAGINDRVTLAESQALPKIQAQIEDAKLDIEEGRYQVALGRLDWILDEMSPYLTEAELAEIGELYSHTLLILSSSGTPTPFLTSTPTTPAFTPTPDLRGEEELYDTAQQQLAAEDWNGVISTLEALRNKNLEYRSVQVDGMLYVALRNRGVDKILIDGSLEPGIYDLTLAEQFAPLDSSAEGFRTWARFYLTGASYWGVDWSQVVYYFEQVYPALPNLKDGTGMTATERFRIGAIQYAVQLANAGDFCAAQEYMDRAMSLTSDPEVQPTQQWIADECYDIQHPPKKDTETPEITPTPTPTPTPGGTTEEPTTEPTTDTPAP